MDFLLFDIELFIIVEILSLLEGSALEHYHTNCIDVGLEGIIRVDLRLLVVKAFEDAGAEEHTLTLDQLYVLLPHFDLPVKRVQQRFLHQLHLVVAIDEYVFEADLPMEDLDVMQVFDGVGEGDEDLPDCVGEGVRCSSPKQ